jgi:hypothetical protein
MIPFADDPVFMDQHRANHGVGGYMPSAQTGQLKTTVHVCFVRDQECKFKESDPIARGAGH